MNFKKLLIGCFVTLIGIGACQSDLDQYRVDPSNMTDEQFWAEGKTSNGLRVLSTIYTNVVGWRMYGRRFSTTFPVLVNDAEVYQSGQPHWFQFESHTYLPSNKEVVGLWQDLYKTVSYCNDLINHHDAMTPTDEFPQEVINDWVGQAHFMRALCYYHLLNLWSEDYPSRNPEARGVPILTKVPENYDEYFAARASVSEGYMQMEQDFLKSIELMIDSPKNTGNQVGMVNRYASYGFLAQVYLGWGKYDEAIEALKMIVDSGIYELNPVISMAYDGDHEYSKEAIMEWEYNDTGFGLHAFNSTYSLVPLYFLSISPHGARANFKVPNTVMERFGDDPRMPYSVLQAGEEVPLLSGGTGVVNDNHTRKFVSTTEPFKHSQQESSTVNICALRLSHVYMMLAEAYNAKGQDGLAQEYLNKIRRRAYGQDPDTPDPSIDLNLSGNELRDEIREDSWREFYHEFNRWYDINRWGITKQELEKMAPEGSDFVYYDHMKYWPLPPKEIENNHNLKQNAGY
ncbi:RagB/SusD family nutrient uptake outer membrane protein [Persicobacter diffluens]|uniref:RagB/SusD family nutrient uptake outer membrane protein n=1 Tax=Persicobacter diffluens TaxID=981 RepID=A0AAN5AMU9_9BACT|nr:hypothetical protein PEDI_47190 [Persicobacter diffluens]